MSAASSTAPSVAGRQASHGGAPSIPAASHHVPPPLNGYVFLEHRCSALSHDAFVARDTRQPPTTASEQAKVMIRVYALEYLRRDEECRFAIERACLAGRLVAHPHTLPLGAPFASKTDLFVVEKYCAGGDLYDVMEARANAQSRGPSEGRSATAAATQDASTASSASSSTAASAGLPDEQVQRLARELLSAVDYLHRSCGLVHRNIKLETLLLDEAGHVRLGGFGLCAVLPPPPEEEASAGAAAPRASAPLRLCCGSKHYAAPELVQGRPYYGEAVDAWACGVVLFALLTGCFPFDSDAGDEALFRLLGGDVEGYLAEHPAMATIANPQAADLVRNLLRRSPETRYSATEALEHPYLATALPYKANT